MRATKPTTMAGAASASRYSAKPRHASQNVRQRPVHAAACKPTTAIRPAKNKMSLSQEGTSPC